MALPSGQQSALEVDRAAPDPGDHRLAHELAQTAGALLVGMRGDLHGAELRAAGDRGSNRFLLDRLPPERPPRAGSADAVLSGESADDGRRVEASRVWIVDPLDGTREYAEPGRDDWA